MTQGVPPEAEFLVHDLLWVRSLEVEADWPSWYPAHQAERPVVIRRISDREPMIPVGVRGTSRHERFPCFVLQDNVFKKISAREVAQSARWREGGLRPLPQFAHLETARAVFEQFSLEWGLGGSLGFELASGLEAATQESDLDLIVYVPKPREPQFFEALRSELQGIPCRVDVQLETPLGAVSLGEWVARNQRSPSPSASDSQKHPDGPPVLMKTSRGPLLSSDPWGIG